MPAALLRHVSPCATKLSLQAGSLLAVTAAAAPPADSRLLPGIHRADSIVRDAEIVRQALVPGNNNGGRWSLLGQSFGGFCALTYLSFAPQGEPLLQCSCCRWTHAMAARCVTVWQAA